jgi:hypothetical protein
MSQTSLQNLSQMSGLSPAELARRAEQLVDAKTGKINVLSALDAALVSTANVQTSFAALGATTASPHVMDDPTHVYSHAEPMGGFAPEAPKPPQIGGPVAQLEKASREGQKRMQAFCHSCCPPPAAEEPPPPPPGDRVGPGSSAPPAEATPPPAAATPPAATPPPDRQAPQAPAQPVRPLSSRPQATGRMGGFLNPSAGAAPTAPVAPGSQQQAPSFSTPDAQAAQGQIDAASMNIQFEKIKMEIQRMTQHFNSVSNTLSAMHEQGMTAIRNVKA